MQLLLWLTGSWAGLSAWFWFGLVERSKVYDERPNCQIEKRQRNFSINRQRFGIEQILSAAESFQHQSQHKAECRLLLWWQISILEFKWRIHCILEWFQFEFSFSFDRSSLCRHCATRKPPEEWDKTWLDIKVLSQNSCYSGKWKMPVEGVRSERIEAQLPRVWHRSTGWTRTWRGLKTCFEMESIWLI